MNAVQSLSRVRLIAAEPERLADFYQAAFGCVVVNQATLTEPAVAELCHIQGATARAVMLRLGEQAIDLIGIHPRGRDMPDSVPGWSPLFQHCALVVSDMATAYERLSAQPGWSAISIGGPQDLPPASGGVTAFKFRDPENHPLELLAFPPGIVPQQWRKHSASGFLGIDHSAISVADTARSIAFYARFGFRRVGGSLNVGAAQDRLDGLTDVRVEVTALAPAARTTPHIELLCYRGAFDRAAAPPRPNDGAATRLVLSVENDADLQALSDQNGGARFSGPLRFADGALRALFRDPDGHMFCLETVPR